MMTKQYVTGFLIWLALVIASTATLAQEQSKPKASDKIQRYYWDGYKPTATECEALFAHAKLMIDVDADFDRAEAALAEIWLKCTSAKKFEGQSEFLIRAVLARAGLLKSQGRQEEALQATQWFLPELKDIPELETIRTQIKLADKARLVESAKIGNDPRFVEFRAQLTQAKLHTDQLFSIVQRAFDSGNYQLIVEIGAPAQPAFMKQIMSNTSTLPSHVTEDPIFFLMQMNERRAAELLLANLDSGDYLFKRRIVRAMEAFGVLRNAGTWSSEAPFVCLEPEWLTLLEALLSAPETALQSVKFISEPFQRDQLSPSLQRSLIRGIDTYGLEFVNGLLQAIDYGGVVQSALPVFEALAQNSDLHVQRFAARALSNYDLNDTLQSFANSNDTIIRTAVVETLVKHRGKWIELQVSRGNGGTTRKVVNRQFNPVLGPQQLELLKQFSVDEDNNIRGIAAAGLLALPEPVEDSIYLKLASDKESWVRQRMTQSAGLGPKLHARILAQLADDPEKFVREFVDKALAEADIKNDPTPFLEALKVRLFEATHLMDEHRREVCRALVRTKAGLEFFTEQILAQEDPDITDLSSSLRDEKFSQVLALDDEVLGGLFCLALKHQQNRSIMRSNLIQELREARPSRGAAMRLVVADTNLEAAIRLTAAELVAHEGGQEFSQAFVNLLRAPYWKTNGPGKTDLRFLTQIAERIPDKEINSLTLQVVRDTQVPDTLASIVAQNYSPAGRGGREVTLAVLERWFGPHQPHNKSVEMAIVHLATLPEDATTELLNAAAVHPSYSFEAIETIVSLRRLECLPVLERCLKAEWIADPDERLAVRLQAARVIPSFLTNEAGEVLLRGLASPNSQVRTLCSVGLSYIEETRARTRRWSAAKMEQPSKESALAELIEMLHAKNIEVRVQAIHGIATFGAIEYLPTLIRLLDDSNSEVADAARTAIHNLSVTAKNG